MVLRAWRFFIKLFIKPLFPSATNFQRCRKLRLEEDRISALPDDVLSNILPLLPLKAAVSTGILSKRWRCLWKQHLLSLNFNYEHVRNLMDHEAFLLMVNQFIRQYESPYLREFILHCRLDHLSTEPVRYIYRLIDGWIAFAISRGVSTLDLDFGLGDCRFPMSLALLDKKTNGLIMEPYLKHRFFKTIKELRLSCIKLSDEDFDAILARCSSLEHLRLSDVRKLINLKHDTPHQKLRQLEVYFMEDLENLELVVPSLVSFKYQGPKINIHFVDAPVLANITMVSSLGLREYKWINSLGAVYPERKEFVFGQFAAYLSQLQYLLMDASSLMERGAFLEVPVFGSLKKLLIYNITSKHCCHAVTSFLKISPLLQRFELHLDKDRMQCDKEEQKPKLTSVSLHKNLKQAWILERQKRKLNPASLHRNLKEVWISGFCGELADMIVAEHILKRAPALEKMEITTYRTIWLWGNMTYYKPNLPDVRECFSKFHLSLPRTAQLYFYHYDNYVDS